MEKTTKKESLEEIINNLPDYKEDKESIEDKVGKYRMYINVTLAIMLFILFLELITSYLIVTRPSGNIYATSQSGMVTEIKPYKID
jgi:hypothetical protein